MDRDDRHEEAPEAPAIPGYALGAVLGRGGFATVWEAAPAGGGAPVAIKVGHGDGAVFVERFRREAEAMESIGAPAVPRLVTAGLTGDGRPYLGMERLFGETLETRLSGATRPLPMDLVARAGDGLLAALARVHERGFVHRDVKPANVFLAAPDDRVVLLDVGLVKAAWAPFDSITGSAVTVLSDLTRTGVAVGTPEYMAPEQIRADSAPGAQVDVYAFGVVLYEMLTLHVPFAGAKAAIEHGHLLLRPRRPSELGEVPRPLEDLVLACLAKDASRRPASASELRGRLAAACAAGAPPEAPREAVSAPKRLIADGRHPVVVAVLDARGDGANVAAAVAARGGFVPRQRGARYVAVFSGLDTEDPVQAALATARALVDDHGARAALHFAEVTLRRRERGAPAAYGAALDRPEAWLPSEPWTGLLFTEAITRLLPKDPASHDATALGPTVDSAAGDVAPDTVAEAPLTGREDLVDALAASVTAAFESGRPALFTLLGEPGTGKTRLAEEAATLAARAASVVRPGTAAARAPDSGPPPRGDVTASVRGRSPGREDGEPPPSRVLRLRAVPPGAGERGRLTGELLRAARGVSGTPREEPTLGHHAAVQAIAEALRERASEGPIAVILDDAQWADDAVLDALEYASLDATKCPLWVFLTSHPRLLGLRSGWGTRTRSAERRTLDPLPPKRAAELAAHLLAPAEYPPAALLDDLARWSGGNPSSLTEIVRALKRAGVVRKRPGGGSYQVVTAVLAGLPASPSLQWLATRRLAALPPELAACLRLGAVLGVAFAREDLEAVQASLERAGGAGTTVDAGAGLAALAAEGLLSASAGDRYAFSNALLHEAIYELIDPAQRVEVHRAALAVHRSLAGPDATPDRLASLARHAAAADAPAEAAAAYLRLGDLAAAKHRHVEADQHYSAALESTPAGEVRSRALALRGRGSARIYIDRARDAVTDLGEARALAASLGDDALMAELYLEEAIGLDWVPDFELSARRAEEARPFVAAVASPVLAARFLVAQGRSAWRRGDLLESIEVLERGLAASTETGDYSGRVIALLCLAWQLASADRPDDAEARFEELIVLTRGRGDLMHLCAAHLNRRSLWGARGNLEGAIADMEQALLLAREIGNPYLELHVCLNIAELLYWAGRTEQAIELARRGCLLAQRFTSRPEGWGLLCLATLLLDRGDREEARRLAEELMHTRPPDLFGTTESDARRSTMLSIVRLVLADEEKPAGSGEDWDALELAAEQQDGSGSSLLGVLYWRARTAQTVGRADEAAVAVRKARAWLSRSPLWLRRFEALSGDHETP